MYHLGRVSGPCLALIGALSLPLVAASAGAAPAQAPEPVVPLFPKPPLPPSLPAAGLAPCPPGLPRLCIVPAAGGLPETLTATPPIRGLPALAGAIGIEAAIGAGVTGFFAQRARALANPGGAWEVRVTLGSRLPLAFEGAYIGSRQNLAMLGLEKNGFVLGNGAESILRFNATRGPVQPYVFGGVGWIKYQLRDTKVRTTDGHTSDDVLQVPFGAGLTLRGRHAFADARATGRLMYNDTLVDQVATSSPGGMGALASWTITARVGWEWF